MSYSIDAMRDDCYPGTSVLVNKLGIQKQTQLDESEALIVGVKSLQFELEPFPGPLDFSYYKALHKFLFDALYDWAGQTRTIGMSKQHTVFCPPDEIEPLAAKMFARVKQLQYFRGLSHSKLVNEVADFYISLNYLHPFREGNGRTQRLFFRQLVANAGYKLDFSAVDGDRMMVATIQAAAGISDPLISIFDEIILP